MHSNRDNNESIFKLSASLYLILLHNIHSRLYMKFILKEKKAKDSCVSNDRNVEFDG